MAEENDIALLLQSGVVTQTSRKKRGRKNTKAEVLTAQQA